MSKRFYYDIYKIDNQGASFYNKLIEIETIKYDFPNDYFLTGI